MLWHYYQTVKDVDTQKYFNKATQLITKIIKTGMGKILKGWLKNICEWYKNVKFTNVFYHPLYCTVKFLYLANNLLLTFTSKAHKNFPNHDWLCHPWPPFLHDPLNKRWPRVTKPIMVGKTPCKLLCAFEVKVSNKLLARYKLLGPS